jgi:hypothetical protein
MRTWFLRGVSQRATEWISSSELDGFAGVMPLKRTGMVARLEVIRHASSTNVHGVHAQWYNSLAADKRNMGPTAGSVNAKKGRVVSERIQRQSGPFTEHDVSVNQHVIQRFRWLDIQLSFGRSLLNVWHEVKSRNDEPRPRYALKSSSNSTLCPLREADEVDRVWADRGFTAP